MRIKSMYLLTLIVFVLLIATSSVYANETLTTTGNHGVYLKINDSRMFVSSYETTIEKQVDSTQGTTPVVKNGRTLLPISTLINELGGTVKWNATERKVSLTLNGNSVDVWIDKTNAVVNGQKRTLDVGPIVMNGRTMVPLRFATENLGMELVWDQDSQIIILYRPTFKSEMQLNPEQYSGWFPVAVEQSEVDPDISKYLDKDNYTDPDKYDEAQRTTNEILGFDYSGLLEDSILDYYSEAYRKQMEQEAIIQANIEKEESMLEAQKDKFVIIIKTDKANIETIWNSYTTTDKVNIWQRLDYDYQIILWDKLSLFDRVGLWEYISYLVKAQFFDQLSDEHKMDVWYLSTDDMDKRFIWVQLRFIDAEKPNELWRMLHENEQLRFYNFLREDDREYLTTHLNQEDLIKLQELLKKPEIEPEVDENGAVG